MWRVGNVPCIWASKARVGVFGLGFGHNGPISTADRDGSCYGNLGPACTQSSNMSWISPHPCRTLPNLLPPLLPSARHAFPSLLSVGSFEVLDAPPLGGSPAAPEAAEALPQGVDFLRQEASEADMQKLVEAKLASAVTFANASALIEKAGSVWVRVAGQLWGCRTVG